MSNKYMVYLSFKGVYDNGHDFLTINPNRNLEIHEFNNLKDAIDFVESKEADYRDLMINEVARFKKENKYFKPYNVDALIMGYVSLEDKDGDELDQWDVFFEKYEPEQEQDEDFNELLVDVMLDIMDEKENIDLRIDKDLMKNVLY